MNLKINQKIILKVSDASPAATLPRVVKDG